MRCSKDKGSPPLSSQAMLQTERAGAAHAGSLLLHWERLISPRSGAHTGSWKLATVGVLTPQKAADATKQAYSPSRRPCLWRGNYQHYPGCMYFTCFLAVGSTDPALRPSRVSCRNVIKHLLAERPCQQGPWAVYLRPWATWLLPRSRTSQQVSSKQLRKSPFLGSSSSLAL